VIGDPNPNWTGSFRTGVRYKKLNVSGLVDVRRGGVIWNGTRGALDNFGTAGETAARASCTYDADGNLGCTGNEKTFGKDFFKGPAFGPGQGTAVPIGENWYTGLGSGFGNEASQFLEDGSYVKLREDLPRVHVRHAVGAPSGPGQHRAPHRSAQPRDVDCLQLASIRRRTSVAPKWRRRGSTTSTIRRRDRS
jgi:hypothetical protein